MDYLALINRYYHNNPELLHVLLTHSRQVCDRALQIVNNHPGGSNNNASTLSS